jgi:protoporphyrinogen oxidase
MHKTVVIIGGGLSGLVSANICSHLGIESIVLEKSNTLGGGNRSFCDKQGNIFDYGYHALDENRSIITTKFFKKVLKNNFYKIKLNRGIILKNNLFRYNEEFSNWPLEFQKLFKIGNSTDNIKNELNKKKISKIYGSKFTNFAFDEILESYPSIKWSLTHGGKVEDFFGLVYPWFFPKKFKTVTRTNEWNYFHDKKRTSLDHYVLYPKNNGFQGFIDGIINDIDKNYCTIKKNIKNLEINIDSKTNEISNIIVDKKLISGDKYFWCASPILLAKKLNIDLKIIKFGKPQTIIFGNFVFKNKINSIFHEILVGSKNHKINRISFPGKISKNQNNLIQVEFAFPQNQFNFDENYWKDSWLKSLDSLGIIRKNNLLENFTLLSEKRGFVSKNNIDFLTKSIKNNLMKNMGENIIIPSFNLGPENINRVIPNVILNTVSNISHIDRK